MSDAWDQIQAIKSKRNSLRERLEKRKKERQDIFGASNVNNVVSSVSSPANVSTSGEEDLKAQCNEIFTAVDNGCRWIYTFQNVSLSIIYVFS